MSPQLTNRRIFVEQRLFEVQVEIERARNEVEYLQDQLAGLEGRATTAIERLEAAETPLACQACSAARSRVAQMRAAAELAEERLGHLESTRDDLLGKLVG